MGNLQGFNAAEVEPNGSFEAIPPGDYDAVIVSSEMKSTKAGTGTYLKIELQIASGQHQNRKLWDQINIQNPNEECQRIGRGTLSAICRAVNVLEPKDSSELHMRPLRISVGVRKREDTGDLQNTIKSYKPRNAGPSGNVSIAVSVPTSPTTTAATHGTKASAPWLAN